MENNYLRIASNVVLGKNVIIYCFANLYGCKIDDNTKIGSFVEIQKDVSIGKKCKVSSHTFICSGVSIGDECFIGHGVMFTNDLYPRSINNNGELKMDKDWSPISTIIEDRVSIGSNATILCGITIGKGSIVGAGSVVTKDIPPGCIVAGNPARILRFLKIGDNL